MARRPALDDPAADPDLRRRVERLEDAVSRLLGESLPGASQPSSGASPPARGEVEMRWLTANRSTVAEQYRGQAIAVLGERVVESAPDLRTVIDRARKNGFGDALFTAVPAAPRQRRI